MNPLCANRLCTVLLTVALAHFSVAASADAQDCEGETVQGPWYSFVLPSGMSVKFGANEVIDGNSVWIESGIGRNRILFFLFAPRHGGKPYRAFVDAVDITNFVEFRNETGVQQMFAVDYKDGSTGLFEGDSQRVTGLRVFDEPLSEEDHRKFQCFVGSIENYAN